MTTQQPMAFYHQDGLVPAWNFAMKYAGVGGHIATLPEIVEARLATGSGSLPWETYFTTTSAEYYGIGADGGEKLIVTHGVGPMSTLEGIKQAYSWEYKDKSRSNRGGRISASEFLELEASGTLFSLRRFFRGPEYADVMIIDVRDYLESWEDAFCGFRSAFESRLDSLLLARLGPKARDYLRLHGEIARDWHSHKRVGLPEGGPYIVQNGAAPNCSYTTFPQTGGVFDWSRMIPRPLEDGLAIAHLLSTSGLAHMHCGGWEGLTNEVSCHEWWNGVRFVGVPSGATWQNGIAAAPQPEEVLRREWTRFMRPNDEEAYLPPRLYRIEQANGEWFTHYPKSIDEKSMDSGEIEFRVRSVTPLGERGQFQVEEGFFLRYRLSQVVAIAPKGANAYELVDVSKKDGRGLTTVTVQFYIADVDISQRLPRIKEIKQDYDLLMG